MTYISFIALRRLNSTTVLFNKNHLRYLSLFAFLILFMSIIWSCQNDNVKQVEKRWIGTYKIDINKSDLGSYDTSVYKNLILLLKEDNQYQFSMNTPFFFSNKGKWSYEDNGDVALTKLSDTYITINDSILIITNPLPKKDYSQVRRIYFTKSKI